MSFSALKISFLFRIRTPSFAVFLILWLLRYSAQASDGIWSVATGGSWTNYSYWNVAIIADGTNALADFSSQDITADEWVTLDASRTVGHLKFNDVTPGQNWYLDQGISGLLTFDVTSNMPSITVSNCTLTIGTPFTSVQGFLKDGSGSLVLTNGNTLSGPVIISNGTVKLLYAGILGTSSNIDVHPGAQLLICTTSNTIADNAVINLRFSGSYGTMFLTNGINETIGALCFDYIGQSAGTWGATGSGCEHTNDNYFAGAGIVTVLNGPNVSVMNQPASGITSNAATLNGDLISGGGTNGANITFFWGLTDGGTNFGTWDNTNYIGWLATGFFSTNITALTTNTTYYYRCYASNSFGSAWAPYTTNFTTTSGGPEPDLMQDFDLWPGAPLASGTYTNSGWIISYCGVQTNTPSAHTLPYVCSMATGGIAYIQSPLMIDGISTISFNIRNDMAASNHTVYVETSYDGTNWTLRMVVTNSLDTWNTQNCQIDEPSPAYVRLLHSSPDGASLIYVDDFYLWDMPTLPMNYFALTGLPSYAFTNQAMTFTLQVWQGTNLWTNYTGTVALSASFGGSVSEANYTFQASDLGIRTFTNSLVYDVNAHHWFDIEDTTNSSLFIHQSIRVFNQPISGTATKLDITGIQEPVSTGQVTSVSIAAVDEDFNLITNFSGQVNFTSSDGSAILPFAGSGNWIFLAAEGGWHTFTNDLIFATVGEHWLNATWQIDTNVFGTEYDITVQGDGTGSNATHLTISDIPRSCNIGDMIGIELEARDAMEKVFTNFTGTISFSSSDPSVSFSGGSNVVMSGLDKGSKWLSDHVQFNTPGTHWLRAEWTGDTNVYALISNIIVNTNGGFSPVWLDLDVIPDGEMVLKDEWMALKVTARTTGGVIFVSYSNTVQFSSSDGSASLPGQYTFIPADQGVHIFSNAFRLSTPGKQNVTVQEQGNPDTSEMEDFWVLDGGATNTTSFIIDSSAVTMLSNFWYDVTVIACGNGRLINTNFSGTVLFTSSDPTASFNIGSYSGFTNGIGRLSAQVSMKSPGEQTIRVSDQSDTNVFGEMNVFVMGGGNYYYVNNAYGSDANSGLSTNIPFASIPQAYSVVGPGDVIIVGGGSSEYTNNIVVSTSGATGRWIGLVGDMDGLYFTNGQGPRIRPANGFGIHALSQSYLAFSGIEVCNCSTGVVIGNGSNIAIIDSEIEENINGIYFSGVTDISLIDNTIIFTTNIAIELDTGCHNAQIKENEICYSYNAIRILNSTNIILAQNHIGDISFDAIAFNQTTTGEIFMNEIMDCGGVGITIDSPAAFTAWANIHNNIISGCSDFAVKITEAATGVQIVNNTIDLNGNGVEINNSANVLLKNNIISSQTGNGVLAYSTNGLVASYNNVYGNVTNWALAASPGTGCVSVIPMYGGADDYHLQSTVGRPTKTGWVIDGITSPCIDAGDPIDLYDKEPIPHGGRIDMGAYGNSEEASLSPGPVMHDIIVTPPINGTISPSGTVWVVNGSNAVFTITPDPNWHILDVTIDGTNSLGPTNSYTFVNVTNSGNSIGATFAIDTYTLNVISAYGTPVPSGLTTNNWNDFISASVDTVVPDGTTTQCVSIGWFGGGSVSSLGSSNSISFNITNNSWITWIWQTNYWLETTPSSYGAVNLTNAWFTRGSNIVLTATPSNGFYFAGWSGDIASPTNPINITMNQAYSLTPNFVQISNSIVVNIGGSGSVNPSGTVFVAYDDMINFSIAADPNSHITRIITNGIDIAGSPYSGNSFTFTNFAWMNIITGGTFGVNFAPDLFTFAVTSPYGSPTPAGIETNTYNTLVYASVAGSPITTGTTQYFCYGWTGSGNVTGGSGTNFSFNITVDSTLDWLWATNYWMTTTSGLGGSVDMPSGWVTEGSNLFINALPTNGYSFSGWTGDFATNDNPLFLTVTSPVSITANFSLNSYDIMTWVNGNGNLSPSGTVWVGHGSNMIFSVIPDANNHIVDVTIDGTNSLAPTNSYTFVNVTNGSHTIEATFAADTYTLNISSVHGTPFPEGLTTNNWNDFISASADAFVPDGTTQYVCIGWTGSGSVPASGSSNSIAFNITNNSALAWNWQTQYWLDVSSGPNGSVDITSDWTNAGANAVITATPAFGYHFAGWTGDLPPAQTNDAVLTLSMTQARSITANFDLSIGSVSIVINPTNANAMGAQWQMTSGPDTAWHTNGFVITGVPGDQAPYTITFNNVAAFTKPVDMTNISITHSATTIVNATYLAGNMILIPGGTFMMGMTASTNGHEVTLSDFYIDVKEVTVGEFLSFCTDTGNTMPAAPTWGWTDTNLPMVNVSWNLASAYATWAGKRMITEAEYEYVMRSGTANQLYPWGNTIDTGNANYFGNIAQPTLGGSYPPNSYGVSDISGNVWEWCGDWYEAPLSGPVTNPTGPGSGPSKVCRGGSWASSPFTLQCAPRYNIDPSIGYSDVGFRCAATAAGGGASDNSSGSVAGVPDWWIQYYFGLEVSFNPNADSDFDGMKDRQEYLAGTDPCNSHSSLKVKGMNKPTGPDFTIQWTSSSGKKYRVERASSLTGGFAPLQTNITATPPFNSFTDNDQGASFFYRIKLE